MKEIAQLDSAFLNHAYRYKWLVSLKSYRPEVNVKLNSVQFAKWLILKDICLQDLSLDVSISDEILSLQLFKICPKLRKLSINKENNDRMTLSFKTLKNIASNCRQLESLEISNVQMPDGGLEVLSRTCHQLQIIDFCDINMMGLNKLITMNNDLFSLNIESSADGPSIGELFDTLGLNCPQLRDFYYDFDEENISTTETAVTQAQIETFTRGCQELETLDLSNIPIAIFKPMYDKLFYFLGN